MPSVVWKLMKKDKAKEEADCTLCSSKFRHKNGSSTTNLLKHLKNNHPATLQFYLDKEKTPGKPSNESKAIKRRLESKEQTSPNLDSSTSDALTTPSENSEHEQSSGARPKTKTHQPNINTALQNLSLEPYKPSDQRKRYIDNLVLEMITTDLQPISVVEDTGFRNLITYLDPRYPIVSRKQLSKKLLPTKYNEERTRLVLDLQKTEFVAITTDQWTSKANDGYTTFTCHHIDDSWKMRSAVLSTRSERKSHTAVNLAADMTKCLEEFELVQKVSAVVTDNAKNATNSVAIAEAQEEIEGGHPCFAHTLNLIIKHSLEKDKKSQRMISKVKNIVQFFRSSTQANDELRDLQKEDYRKLKQQCETRWNSCLTMLQSYQEQHKSICSILAHRGKVHMCLNEAEFDSLKTTVGILGVYLTATEEMSAEKYISISKIIPLVTMLKGISDKSEASLARHISSYIDQYFGSIEKNSLLSKATFLDPRFKTKLFLDDSAKNDVKYEIKSEMESLSSADEDRNKKTDDDDEEEEEKKKKSSDEAKPAKGINAHPKLWAEFDEEIEKERKGPAAKNAVDFEFEAYTSLERLRRKEDPLAWWRDHEKHLPKLARLAKKYLAIPATSVPSERVFSKAGQLVSARRANLNPKNVDMILFLNKN